MALPSISDLKLWVGTLFTKDDWDFNFTKIVSWFSDGSADLVVNSIRSTNGIDLDGSQLTNVGTATSGSSAINLDQAQTLLNRTSYYYPFSLASGRVNSSGNSAFLQKDSDTQVTVLAGNTNPDLVVIQSDGTVESITSNYILTVETADGTYNIVKEKEGSPIITSGEVTIGKTFPGSPNAGDYFLDNSIVPFVGYKYNAEGGWVNTPFCHLGYVTKTSGNATVYPFDYNNNRFDINIYNLTGFIEPDYDNGIIHDIGSATSATFTAPADGLIWISVKSSGSGSISNATINGNVVMQAKGIGSGYTHVNYGTFLVSKGDVIVLSSPASGDSDCGYRFFPLKGVN